MPSCNSSETIKNESSLLIIVTESTKESMILNEMQDRWINETKGKGLDFWKEKKNPEPPKT
jgi:hypothetical protein